MAVDPEGQLQKFARAMPLDPDKYCIQVFDPEVVQQGAGYAVNVSK